MSVILNNVSKSFENLQVIDNINITVEKGEFVSVIGPSGCGKSTIFKLITKLKKEYSGNISVEGKNIKDFNYHVGYMPQNDLLLPWKTVLENVMLPIKIDKDNNTTKEKVLELLDFFGLKGFEYSYPKDLSGGMKQRTALLRTMNMGSDLLLLDEPFGAIDSINRLRLQEWLLKIFQKYNKTVLFITHDIDEAILLSNKIYVLSDRPATVIEEIKIPFKNRDKNLLTDIEFIKIKEKIINLLEQ